MLRGLIGHNESVERFKGRLTYSCWPQDGLKCLGCVNLFAHLTPIHCVNIVNEQDAPYSALNEICCLGGVHSDIASHEQVAQYTFSVHFVRPVNFRGFWYYGTYKSVWVDHEYVYYERDGNTVLWWRKERELVLPSTATAALAGRSFFMEYHASALIDAAYRGDLHAFITLRVLRLVCKAFALRFRRVLVDCLLRFTITPHVLVQVVNLQTWKLGERYKPLNIQTQWMLFYTSVGMLARSLYDFVRSKDKSVYPVLQTAFVDLHTGLLYKLPFIHTSPSWFERKCLAYLHDCAIVAFKCGHSFDIKCIEHAQKNMGGTSVKKKLRYVSRAIRESNEKVLQLITYEW